MDKSPNFRFRTETIQAIDKSTGNAVSWESVASQYPESVVFSKYADVTGVCDTQSLNLSWATDIGVKGSCALPRSRTELPSDLIAMRCDWNSFKEHVSGLVPRHFLFRGQNKPWRLRTPFHRSGRAEMHRFVLGDVPALHKHLSSRTKHVFNLRDADQNGAFYSLVQHHGYPTPLLDWTYSPYVAAFFAYRHISNVASKSAASEESVRILIFDHVKWSKDWVQVLNLVRPSPNFSVCEFIAIENERVVPQQSVSTLANVDDIEGHVLSKESDTRKYLRAIDLPVSERRRVIRELGYMGVTAGALFPGLDGACEELAERNFEI